MTKRSFSDTLEVCWLMFKNLLLIHWSSIESEAKVDFRCVEYEEKIGFVAWLHSIANTGMIEWSRTETYFYFTLTTPKICICSRYKTSGSKICFRAITWSMWHGARLRWIKKDPPRTAFYLLESKPPIPNSPIQTSACSLFYWYTFIRRLLTGFCFDQID